MLVRRLYGVMLCDVQSSKHAKPRRNVAREEKCYPTLTKVYVQKSRSLEPKMIHRVEVPKLIASTPPQVGFRV